MLTKSRPYIAPFAPGGVAELDEARLHRLLELALARGGDYADVFCEYRVRAQWLFEDGIVKGAARSVRGGAGVRVCCGDRTGYASTESLAWDDLVRAATTASMVAGGGESRRSLALSPRAIPARYDGETSFDVAPADKLALLERATREARRREPRVLSADANLEEEVREILVATSDGDLVRDVQPLLRFGVRVLLRRDGVPARGTSAGGGRTALAYFEERGPEWHAARAVDEANARFEARDCPAGTMAVVLGPGDSGILVHEAVGHGLEADLIRKGTSNYANKVGQAVASPLCTVVDDPGLPFARGSINVDDEGKEPRRTVLIAGGRLAGYLHDRRTAAHERVDAGGSARRADFASAPMPRMSNTALMPGPHSRDEIVASVKHGIYAKKLGGGKVDIASGDFVFNVTEGHLIEDGRITAPLKSTSLVGNGPEVLRNVVMVGSDLEWSDGMWGCLKNGQDIPVGVGSPTVKVSAMTVSGARSARG